MSKKLRGTQRTRKTSGAKFNQAWRRGKGKFRGQSESQPSAAAENTEPSSPEPERCLRCNKTAEAGKTHCADCAGYKSCWSQNRYDLRVLKKLCVICGVNKVEKFRACVSCRMKKAKTSRAVLMGTAASPINAPEQI